MLIRSSNGSHLLEVLELLFCPTSGQQECFLCRTLTRSSPYVPPLLRAGDLHAQEQEQAQRVQHPAQQHDPRRQPPRARFLLLTSESARAAVHRHHRGERGLAFLRAKDVSAADEPVFGPDRHHRENEGVAVPHADRAGRAGAVRGPPVGRSGERGEAGRGGFAPCSEPGEAGGVQHGRAQKTADGVSVDGLGCGGGAAATIPEDVPHRVRAGLQAGTHNATQGERRVHSASASRLVPPGAVTDSSCDRDQRVRDRRLFALRCEEVQLHPRDEASFNEYVEWRSLFNKQDTGVELTTIWAREGKERA